VILLERKKTVIVQDSRPGRFLFHAHLEDDAHIIDLQLVVDEERGEVLSAYANMGMAPYGDRCRAAMGVVDQLVGHRIGPGSAREVFRIVAGPTGCTHVAELVIDAFRTFIPSIGVRAARRKRAELTAEGLAEDVVEERVMEEISRMGQALLPETCIVYSANRQMAPTDHRDQAGQEGKDRGGTHR
jgi:hypothetical protein